MGHPKSSATCIETLMSRVVVCLSVKAPVFSVAKRTLSVPRRTGDSQVMLQNYCDGPYMLSCQVVPCGFLYVGEAGVVRFLTGPTRRFGYGTSKQKPKWQLSREHLAKAEIPRSLLQPWTARSTHKKYDKAAPGGHRLISHRGNCLFSSAKPASVSWVSDTARVVRFLKRTIS